MGAYFKCSKLKPIEINDFFLIKEIELSFNEKSKFTYIIITIIRIKENQDFNNPNEEKLWFNYNYIPYFVNSVTIVK